MLYRFAETNLDIWLNKSNRKPLVLRGARQVGKSTLVRESASYKLLSLPLYLIEALPKVLNGIRSTLSY
jgi:predicted AAA+ superfamily ATPase